MRVVEQVTILLSALVLNLATLEIGAAADWPQDYIVHENSASPDGRDAILVLSKQAAIDQDQTDGNITYLANLQTHQTLGEILGTDYFEGQNHRDLQVLWALTQPPA